MEKYVHKNPIFFSIIEDIEADSEIVNFNIGKKTNIIHKQNPVCNGYYILSQLESVLKSDDYSSNLDYDKVDWFVNEVIKLKKKVGFPFQKH